MFEFKKNRLKSACAVLVLACLGGPLAKADTLGSGPVTLLDHTQLVGGSFSTALDFLAPAAGHISVTLTDLAWPQTIQGLSFAATSATSMLASLAAPGSLSFDVNGPGHYFAIISGVTQGALDLGLYSLNIHWNALSTSSVPLPAAGWLLISGTAGLLSLARRRKSAPALALPATV